MKYAYPGSPDDTTGWSMCQEEAGRQDVRALMSTSSFDLEPGEAMSLSMAVLFAEDIDYPCPSITPLTDIAEQAQSFYDQSVITSSEAPEAEIVIFPNPASDWIHIQKKKEDTRISRINLFNTQGILVSSRDGHLQSEVKISTTHLPSGIYSIIITMDSNLQVLKKVMVH